MIYNQKSLFPDMFKDAQDKAKEQANKKWLAQKNKNFGLEFCSNATFSGKYGIPLIKPYIGSIPKLYTTFGNINRIGCSDCCVTGFDYDYVLERMWNHPERYVETLSHYMCVAEPDFSLKINNPLSVQIANTYRSHVLAFYMQEHCINVLPSMSWGAVPSYDFCFDGHSKGGAVIVSTIGIMKDDRMRMFFKCGFTEMLNRILPGAVILYGDINEEMLSWMPKQLDIHHFNHYRFNRARNHGK